MSRIRSIIFVLSSLKFGGGERVALNLAQAMKAKGLHVEFWLMSNEGEYLAEAQRSFEVIDLNCNRTWKLPFKLMELIRKKQPDVLISSFWKLNLCACLARSVLPAVKLLLWEHSPPSKSKNSPKWLYAITASVLYKFSTYVIAVSNGVRSDVLSLTIGLGSKVKTIYNPIPAPREFTGASVRDSVKRIIWVGRLDNPKNPALMIKAFSLLPLSLRCTLSFIGDGPQRHMLEKQVSELGIEYRVTFHGYQPNPYDYIARSDILVVSSDREGLPTVLIEALYCGLDVISTDCGEGVHEILEDGRYGEIVPLGCEQSMANAIDLVLSKPRDLLSQINGAQRFKPDYIADQFLSLLDPAIK